MAGEPPEWWHGVIKRCLKEARTLHEHPEWLPLVTDMDLKCLDRTIRYLREFMAGTQQGREK